MSSVSANALRNKRWVELLRRFGSRYERCRIENYQLSETPEVAAKQAKAVQSLLEYCGDIPTVLRTGGGLVIYGPCGTGKDHLMVGAIHKAIGVGVDVMFVYAIRMFDEFSKCIGPDAKNDIRSLAKKYAEPEILAISDLLPASGGLSGFHKECLYHVVNERYKDQKPIWLTMNARDINQMREAFGPQVTSRLADGSLGLNCEWPDWRLKK